MSITRGELLAFLRTYKYCAQSSRSPEGVPQVALMGAVVSDSFEVFFDTLATTRKLRNLRHDARCAFAFGSTAGGDLRTVQLDGPSDEPRQADLERLKALYFGAFPQGREREGWPGMTYLRVRPTWLRYADYGRTPPLVCSFDAEALAALR